MHKVSYVHILLRVHKQKSYSILIQITSVKAFEGRLVDSYVAITIDPVFCTLSLKYLFKCFVDLRIIRLNKYIGWDQLYAVTPTQQGRQKEPSVKTLRSPFSAEF